MVVVKAMGSIDPPELSLDFGPVSILTETTVANNNTAAQQEKSCGFVPKTIIELIGEVSAMDGNVQEKLLKLDYYVRRLDDEMRKIDAFKRELPLCMLLLNDAIKTVKEESTKYRKSANAEPVLEEFIPIKKTPDDDDEKNIVDTKTENNDCRDKMSWMSSVQLWNSDITPSPRRTDFQLNRGQDPKPDSKKRTIEEQNQDGFFISCKSQGLATAFAPFKGCSGFPMSMTSKENGYELPGVPKLSLNTPVLGTKKPREDLDIVSSNLDSKVCAARAVPCSLPSVQSNLRVVSQQQQSNSRKQRRCWSPELHRRFVDALHKLGGCQG
ncbi:OLC1v1003042C3 [Oldenlandia corymbosa var. corymbosa]|uniref:OLC1v1003042C3 n=1 Tax=Oldenlandia corymbosa var. corymbosa TaxID=529605 RepID=A0AAV1DC00_OLDCO|nr:OLC1v1003042C3 [Oldenlandia corymbosa var. corymbosa]